MLPSGLGEGLQNPLRRFDSAHDLTLFIKYARVAESVDARVLKTLALIGVRVRVSPRVQLSNSITSVIFIVRV